MFNGCLSIDGGEEDAIICTSIHQYEDKYLAIYQDTDGWTSSYVYFYTTIKPTVEVGDTLKGWQKQ